jgi:transcriptional regulator with XRE-family HTH domain
MPINIEAINKIMLNKGMNQVDLAKKMNVTKSRVSRILSDEVSNSQIKTIHSLATALGVEPVDILKEDK